MPLAPFVVLAAMGPLVLALAAPAQTHVLTIAFPQALDKLAPRPSRTVHRIGVTITGQATLDGAFLSDLSLRNELASWTDDDELPGIVFEPEPQAAYGDSVRILAMVHAAGLARWQFCFGGLAHHRDFDKDWRTKPMYLSIPYDPEKNLERPDPDSLRCNPSEALPPQAE